MYRARPGDVAANPDHAGCEGHTTLNEHPHRQRSGMPSTCHQSFEQARGGSVSVKMEWLRIEFAREPNDVVGSHFQRARLEALPDTEIVEKQRANAHKGLA